MCHRWHTITTKLLSNDKEVIQVETECTRSLLNITSDLELVSRQELNILNLESLPSVVERVTVSKNVKT